MGTKDSQSWTYLAGVHVDDKLLERPILDRWGVRYAREEVKEVLFGWMRQYWLIYSDEEMVTHLHCEPLNRSRTAQAVGGLAHT